jgi:hypothetical protein
MSSVCESKVKLQGKQVSWVEKRRELHTCTAAYAMARGVTRPSIPCLSALFARLGGPVPFDLGPCGWLSCMKCLSSAEDGDVNIILNVCGMGG